MEEVLLRLLDTQEEHDEWLLASFVAVVFGVEDNLAYYEPWTLDEFIYVARS